MILDSVFNLYVNDNGYNVVVMEGELVTVVPDNYYPGYQIISFMWHGI